MVSVELQEDRVKTAGGVKVQLDIGTVAPRWLIPEVAVKADRAVCELLAHWERAALPDAGGSRWQQRQEGQGDRTPEAVELSSAVRPGEGAGAPGGQLEGGCSEGGGQAEHIPAESTHCGSPFF